jgi:hypothetical protein
LNILHVEDDIDWFERVVRPSLNDIGVGKICHADTYKKGIEFLQSEQIDYVVLDLAIPLDDKNQSPEVSYGLKLATYIRINFPGTPVLILTGQRTEEAVEQFVEDQDVTIFWDGKAKSLVKVRPKRRLDKVIDLLADAVVELEAIDAIDIEANGCELDNLDQRVLKLFCKHNGAIAARVKSLDEGLSSAKVLQVNLINEQGQDIVWTALVKVDTKENIDVEDLNFNSFVNKLPVGSYPNILNQYFAGCANKKGIFYRFATEYNSNYFKHLTENEENALCILTKIRQILDTWNKNKQVKQVLISEVRKTLCSDIKFIKLESIKRDLGLDEFERKTINANYCIQHSDLHGQNILVSEELTPILIDYGDIQEASSVLDIVTLELSQYFHPSMKSLELPAIELFENWFDDEENFKLSPFPKVAKFLRAWKTDNSFMTREYIVTVYAYAIRQLTYKNTNKSFAIALIKSAIAAYK